MTSKLIAYKHAWHKQLRYEHNYKFTSIWVYKCICALIIQFIYWLYVEAQYILVFGWGGTIFYGIFVELLAKFPFCYWKISQNRTRASF